MYHECLVFLLYKSLRSPDDHNQSTTQVVHTFRYKLKTYIIKTRINFGVSDLMRSFLIDSILIEVGPKHSRQTGYEGLIFSFLDNKFYCCFHHKC